MCKARSDAVYESQDQTRLVEVDVFYKVDLCFTIIFMLIWTYA